MFPPERWNPVWRTRRLSSRPSDGASVSVGSLERLVLADKASGTWKRKVPPPKRWHLSSLSARTRTGTAVRARQLAVKMSSLRVMSPFDQHLKVPGFVGLTRTN
jgi:hypothetical protein